MAPQYGEVRVDYITYTTGVVPNEGNATAYVSGLINSPTFSGNVIVEGNTTIDGNLNVSGDINASGVVISGITGLFDDGTEAAPSIAFASDPDTGIYKPATNEIGFSTNGGESLRIDSSGRVGIGTSSPASKLHIQNTSANDGIRITSSTTGQGFVLFGDTADSNTGSIVYEHANDAMTFDVNNSERLRIDSSGNVGIGTSSPSKKLEISESSAEAGIVLNSSGRTLVMTSHEQSGVSQATKIGTTSNHELRIITNDTERLRIDSSGNVGIGTTNPTRNLEVKTGTGIAGFKQSSSSLATTLEFLRNGVGTSTNNAIEISTTSGLEASIDYSGGAYFAGNVGIGTSSPQATTHVRTDGNAVKTHLYLQNRDAGASSGGEIVFSNSANDLADNRQAYIRALTSGAGQNGNLLTFGTNPNGGSPTERLRIDSSGNVGIGTSSPTGKLHIESAATAAGWQLRTDSVGLSNESGFYRDGSDNYELVLRNGAGGLSYLKNDGGASTANLSFNVQGSERLRIASSGNVGIGTSNPNAKLTVMGTIYQGAGAFGSNVSYGGRSIEANIDINSTSMRGGILVRNANDFRDLTDSASFMHYDAYTSSETSYAFRASKAFSGTTLVDTFWVKGTGEGYFKDRVGIGTTSPTNQLHIFKGTAVSDLATLKIEAFRPKIRFQDRSAFSNSAEISGDNALIFSVSPAVDDSIKLTERMRIDANGSVGIGTSSPSGLLHLEGSGNTDLYITGGTSNNSRIWFGDSADRTEASIQYSNTNNLISISKTGGTGIVVDSSNNVGIGTSSPQTTLEVRNGTPSGTLPSLGGLLVTNAGTSSSTAALCVATGSGPVFNVMNDGKVGIGTDDPSNTLSISSNTPRIELTDTDTSARCLIDCNSSTGSVFFRADEDNALDNSIIGFIIDGSAKARILANGNFGIGTSSPQTPLHVIGDIRGSILAGTGNRLVYSAPSGTLTNSSSDATLKTKVTKLTDQLEIVKQLNPVAYNWIDTEILGEQREIGFIAQEVEPLIPEVIGKNHNGKLSVDYPKITAVLTKALQEAILRIEALEQRLTDL